MDEFKVGEVYEFDQGRYRYKGGDPKSQESWESVAEAQKPVMQPGATGMAAFGADPNYFNALSGAMAGIGGEVAQGATASYSDEMGIPRRDDVPGPVSFVAQGAGALLPAFLGGPLAARAMAGFPSRVMGGGIAGTAGAAAYASGAAEPGSRGTAALTAAPFGFGVGAGLPLAAGAAHRGGQMVRKMFGFPIREPVDELATSIGPRNLAAADVSGRETLADALGMQGEVAIRRLGPSLDVDDAGDIERALLARRREAPIEQLDDAVSSIVAPGTARDARRQLAQEAYQTYQNLEAPPAAQEIVRRIRDSGGTQLVARSRSPGRVGTDPLLNIEAQRIIREARKSNLMPVSQMSDELRDVMDFALREGNDQWARAMRAEAVDDIISKAEAAGELSRRALPSQLPNTLRRDLERTLSDAEFDRFIEAYQRIASDQNRTVGLTDAVRSAYGEAFKMDDTITQELTAAAYLGAGQPGAASRTGILAWMKEAGRPARQSSAREQMRLLLEEDPAVSLRALRERGPMLEAQRRATNRRAGILSTYVGSGTGGLLGGR